MAYNRPRTRRELQTPGTHATSLRAVMARFLILLAVLCTGCVVQCHMEIPEVDMESLASDAEEVLDAFSSSMGIPFSKSKTKTKGVDKGVSSLQARPAAWISQSLESKPTSPPKPPCSQGSNQKVSLHELAVSSTEAGLYHPLSNIAVPLNPLASKVDISTNQQYGPLPKVGISTNEQYSSLPKVDISTNQQYSSLPKIDISATQQYSSLPKVGISTNQQYISLPKVDVSTNQHYISLPKVEISTINRQKSSPVNELNSNRSSNVQVNNFLAPRQSAYEVNEDPDNTIGVSTSLPERVNSQHSTSLYKQPEVPSFTSPGTPLSLSSVSTSAPSVPLGVNSQHSITSLYKQPEVTYLTSSGTPLPLASVSTSATSVPLGVNSHNSITSLYKQPEVTYFTSSGTPLPLSVPPYPESGVYSIANPPSPYVPSVSSYTFSSSPKEPMTIGYVVPPVSLPQTVYSVHNNSKIPLTETQVSVNSHYPNQLFPSYTFPYCHHSKANLPPLSGSVLPHPFTVSSQPHPSVVSPQLNPLAVSSQPNPFAVSSQPNPFAVNSQPYSFAVSSQPYTLAVDSQPHPFAVSSQHPQHLTATAPYYTSSHYMPQPLQDYYYSQNEAAQHEPYSSPNIHTTYH